MKKRLILCGILFITSTLSTSVENKASEKQDSSLRFIRIPSGTGTSQSTANRYNTVSIPIAESTVSPAKVLPQKPLSSPASTATTPKSYGSTIFEVQDQMQPPNANAGHFIFSMSPQSQSPATQGFIPTAGPMLMQILTPQGQPTGQVQYIQFLQPVVVPLMSKNYLPQITQSQASQSQPQIPVQSASAAVAQQYQPTTQSPPLPTSGYYPYSQQPVASYSTPVASYYHPSVYSSNRIQIVSGPGDLSLNTNEYMPAASEISFSAVKPRRA